MSSSVKITFISYKFSMCTLKYLSSSWIFMKQLDFWLHTKEDFGTVHLLLLFYSFFAPFPNSCCMCKLLTATVYMTSVNVINKNLLTENITISTIIHFSLLKNSLFFNIHLLLALDDVVHLWYKSVWMSCYYRNYHWDVIEIMLIVSSWARSEHTCQEVK